MRLDVFGHFPTNLTLYSFYIHRRRCVWARIVITQYEQRIGERARKGERERGIKGEGNVLQVDCPYWRRHATARERASVVRCIHAQRGGEARSTAY